MATVVVARFKLDPEQIGLLLLGVGMAGLLLMVTFTVPAPLLHPFTVVVRLYAPDIDVVALVKLGFCEVEVKPLGPDQA